MERGSASFQLLTLDHPVVAPGHQHVPLLGGADRGGGLGDVWEMGQPVDVVEQAAGLGVGGVAVGVAVLLLDVPPELPTLPLLQDLRLDLGSQKLSGEKAGRPAKAMTCKTRRLTSLLTKQYKMATSRPCGDNRHGTRRST